MKISKTTLVSGARELGKTQFANSIFDDEKEIGNHVVLIDDGVCVRNSHPENGEENADHTIIVSEIKGLALTCKSYAYIEGFEESDGRLKLIELSKWENSAPHCDGVWETLTVDPCTKKGKIGYSRYEKGLWYKAFKEIRKAEETYSLGVQNKWFRGLKVDPKKLLKPFKG